jgi:hypothetical protein
MSLRTVTPRARTDDEGELHLPVDCLRLRRQNDGIARADQRDRVLGEERWVRRKLAAHLLDMRAVVQAEANDLVRLGNDRREIGFFERQCACAALRARAPVRVREERSDVGEGEKDDAVAFQAACIRPVGRSNCDESHYGRG